MNPKAEISVISPHSNAPQNIVPNPPTSPDALSIVHDFEASIVDCYREGPEGREKVTFVRRSASVFDVLYGLGPSALMDSVTPKTLATTSTPRAFRWIHLPTVNLEWIEDLMYKIQFPVEQAVLDNVWKSYQLRGSTPHSYSFDPLCQILPNRSNASSGEDSNKIILVQMPFLSYETSESLLRMTRAIRTLQGPEWAPIRPEISQHERLAKAYMSASNPGRRWSDPPLRIQRTLDQFFDPTEEDTEYKDQDQLIMRASAQKDYPMATLAVVDQMVLWTDGISVISSFPQRLQQGDFDTFSFINASLTQGLPCKSAHDLAALITAGCTDLLNSFRICNISDHVI
ncbi:hypothetical protein BU16DRAFT_612319 [Lophium mytilinum]|uniref:Uncharacterized protein n=1 Tax=Lophium mytilinum TaxID=390894 RepID=A0A6A6RDQ6_9PEZI|nr:hypothetical protein BU16DRAFT_612319 [Lophium mytilinum]